MAKLRDRICVKCGDIEYQTRTPSEVCLRCSKEDKKLLAIQYEQELLEDLGYYQVRGPEVDKNGHRLWTFIHECGKEQTWVFGNILKRLKADKMNLPCSKCGSERRTGVATARFVELYGRNYDFQEWEDYRQKVRYLSNKTYDANRDTIDPDGHGRSIHGWHLDHIVPIIEGFKHRTPPEEMARKENLQMLPAFDNLSKGRT